MDLFRAMPTLRRHPKFEGKAVALIGVSTIVRDEAAFYFEIGKPEHWQNRQDGTAVIGVGGIGGSPKRDESLLACLRREVEEELGVRVQLEPALRTYVIRDWQVADTLELSPSKKYPTPFMVILLPPRLGGAGTPDHLAILAFRTRLRGVPRLGDLFGLMGIAPDALATFFGREEWPANEALARPGFTLTLGGPLPERAVLRPVLTARAFQSLVRGGYM